MSDVKKVHVDGKVYDIKDSKSVATLGDAYPDIATLDAFVKLTDSTREQWARGYSFTFRDTGGWGPKKTANSWYRCLIARYLNPIVTQKNVFGTALLTEGSSLYIGYIDGITSFKVSWYSIIEYGQNTMWEALPATIVMANGHITASPDGWVALTTHGSSGDLVNRWRLQLGNDGAVQVYKSTNSGSSWQHVANLLRADQISTWTAKALTANSSYVTSLGSWTRCYYNSAIKLATLNFNFYISTAVSAANTILISGLPKPFAASACDVSPQQVGTSIRLYVQTDGTLKTDQAAAAGWYNGSVTYPYSSL